MTHVYLPNINVQFVNEKGKLSEAGYRFLYFLWERTGGHEDVSAISLGNDNYYWNTPSFENDIYYVSTATDITTPGNAVIIATSNITVTLNPYPADKEKVTIKRATSAGSVIINGGAYPIDGAAIYTLITNYEAAQCIYSAIDNGWFIV